MSKWILMPDSFKGTMSSLEICRLMREALLRHVPDAEVVSIPVADGGEGSVEAFLADDAAAQAGGLSFRGRGRDCEDLGEALGDAGIAVRAGLHCAPVAHRTAGTLETGTLLQYRQ